MFEIHSLCYERGTPKEITIKRYAGGQPGLPASGPVEIPCEVHTHEDKLLELTGKVYVYCRFNPVPKNPVEFMDGKPSCRQTVTLGLGEAGRAEAVTFGMVDDDRTSAQNKARYVPGLSNGKIDFFGMYARPGTGYNFKIHIDLDRQCLTAWVAGEGDEEWFVLAAEVELTFPVNAIGGFRVDQFPDAPGIENLVIQSAPWPQGEAVRPHPKAKGDRAVAPEKGFKVQPMRSLWRQAERHVTVTRRPAYEKGWFKGYWPGWWLGFPDVVQTGPTDLVCTHNDGPGHGGGGKIWVRHSNDLGKTWTKAIVVRSGGCNCPRIQKLKDGSLLLTADIYANPYCNVFYRSTDGGHTWTQVGWLDPVAAGGHDCCVPSRVTEMSDGSWLVVGSWASGQAFKLTQGEVLEFYRSGDQGKTWKFYGTLRENPRSFSEASIVPLSDGRWLMVIREGYGRLPGVRCYSSDEGKTWSKPEELPIGVHGRTCADLLPDGRVMMTARAYYGPVGLWAWIDDPDGKLPPYGVGVHFNDKRSVGLKDGELYIDSDGVCGQFTKYIFRCPNSYEDRIELTTEVKVVSNKGRAASLSVPYVGRLRIFPDRAEFAHDPKLRIDIAPGRFHTYRILSQGDKTTILVDDVEWLVLPRGQEAVANLAWSTVKGSAYPLEFGNEEAADASAAFDYVPDGVWKPPVETPGDTRSPVGELAPTLLHNITPAVTGCSIWRKFDVRYGNPGGEYYTVSWNSADGNFPDQYQLDHVIEVEGSISGCDQGYSGWTQLSDGRILVLNYTDDTARWNCDATFPPLGVSWIRGTYIHPGDVR